MLMTHITKAKLTRTQMMTWRLSVILRPPDRTDSPGNTSRAETHSVFKWLSSAQEPHCHDRKENERATH